MRVLFVTPTPPLLTKPRPHHFIRGLAARGHAVHLLLGVESPEELDALPDAPGWNEAVRASATVDVVVIPRSRSLARAAGSLPTRTPLRVAYARAQGLRRRAEHVLRREAVDVAHVDRERLAPLLADLPAPKVLDATDSITLYLRGVLRHAVLPERAVAAAELLKMPTFERRMANGYAACLLTTPADADAVRATGSRGRLEVVPNGVDGTLLALDRVPRPDTLVFAGTMFYPPNVDAARWLVRVVWPLVRRARPDARVQLVGHRPSAAVRRLADVPGVEVTGTVPAVAPYLAAATAFVAPLRVGGGFPNKVGEALAAGVPVVATPAAHAGISGLEPGRHLLVGDSPQAFADAVLRVMADAGLAGGLAREGRAFAAARLGWDAVAEQLEATYATAIGGR